MKYRTILLVLIGLGLTGFQSRHADFSGTWALNLKQSKNLRGSFSRVKSFRMNIVQGSDSMVVNTRMEGAGQQIDFPPTVYRFDGSEAFREDTLRGSKHWTTSTWATTGQKLVINDRVVHRQETKEQHYTQTEVWQFGRKNTLMILITQKFADGDSTHTEQRYYQRAR